jgi:hypothetical protein
LSEGAQIDQVVPVAVVASQSRGFQREDRTDLPAAHRRQQRGKARSFDHAAAGLALIVIDHLGKTKGTFSILFGTLLA